LEDKAQADIIILVISGCLGMLVLVAFIILFVLYYQKKVLAQKNQLQLAENKYQRELLSAAIQVEEKERERIAKNIHDDVGTLLNFLKLNLHKVAHSADINLNKSLMEENLKLLEDSIQGIRGVAKDLIPPTLVKLGYIKGLNELCRHINNSGQVIVNFSPDAAATRLPEQTELQLYRITKELLNNIIKHTGAKKIDMEFKEINSSFRLLISHDGRGITSQEAMELSKTQKGLGLKSIQSRAQLINAVVQYKIKADHTAFITVELPSAN
jgi:signal transduction histidine kinase